MKSQLTSPLLLRGLGIGTKRVCGKIKFLHHASTASTPTRTPLSRAAEWSRLSAALSQTKQQISALYERALHSIGEAEAEIFEIHGMLLEDEDFRDAIHAELDKGQCAEDALQAAAESISQMLAALSDPYLSARAADVKDVASQVMRTLTGESQATDPSDQSPFILVADDLTPSETVLLEKSQILGFVTFRGTPNSHTAILARAMGIPALVSVGIIDEIYDGTLALLDAQDATLTLAPTEEQHRVFTEKINADDRIARDHDRYLRSLMNKPAVTRGGHRMLIYANIGDGDEVEAALANGADGIGLLRSEFLYLGCKNYPSEETLFNAYRDVAIRMQGKRVVIRTLDIGADKKIAYFDLPEEENPALGFRAIRICLARKDIFKTQLRAILRASAFGRLSLMLPMIVSPDEVRQTKQILRESMDELRRENHTFDANIELGVMIETPAAVMMSDELAAEVDFFSVGTNDLSQYTLAADRQNPALAALCDENREPVLRMIELATKAIHHTGGWIGICGEMAADLHLTQRWADLGIDELSVSVPYLLGLRGKVTECL